jgi:phosphatidylinositol alpha-1,6-mannosyltransferase
MRPVPVSKAKSLLLTDKFVPHQGGTAVIYYNWARFIPRGNMAILTCTVPGKPCGEVDRQLEASVYRVPFVNIPKLRFPLCWLTLFLTAPLAIFRERPGVLHAGQPLETGWIAWFWGVICRKPYVLHCFGDEIALYWDARVAGHLMRFVARRAARITVISHYSAAKLKALGLPDDRIVLVYPGVSWSARADDPEGTRDTSDDRQRRPVLLTVGRLVTRKGHDRVITALPKILARIPGVEYVIVGTGSEERRLRRLAEELGVASAVTFVGGVPQQATRHYYQRCDVFVHPNRELENGEVEGLGIVFLEASACGVPVIGGNSGGTPDAIQDGVTGFLVDPNSVEEIADRIIFLLENPVIRTRMGRAGQDWAAQFTWRTAAEKIWALAHAVVTLPPPTL